jgi:hypothetical protein
MISLICVFICSTRAFDSPLTKAAWTLDRCSVILLASLTNDGRRHRLAHFSQCSSSAIVCCYEGVSASSGAEGVGRAINDVVVLAFARPRLEIQRVFPYDA